MSVEFKDNSKAVKAALEAAILEALQGIGEAAEKHAKEKAPVDTGNLRDHIRHAVSEDEKAVYIGTYDKEVPYALYVEVGVDHPEHIQRPVRDFVAQIGAADTDKLCRQRFLACQ